MPTNLVSAFNIVAIIIGLLCLVIMLTFAGISAREKEPRAARRALVGAFLLPIPYIGAGIIGLYIASPLISLIILFSTGVLCFSFVLPIGDRFPEEHDMPTTVSTSAISCSPGDP